MGMYNYIGTSGDQVKCFYVPCISISPDNTVCMGSMGGRLECVNNTPYMTPYYNYGKDFGILTFDLAFTPLETGIHIVRDGKWVETLLIMEMPDEYDLPPVIVNNYGTMFKVDSTVALKQMLQEYDHANKEHDRILFDALEANNLHGRYPDMTEFRAKPHEEAMWEITIRSEINDMAYKATQKITNEKWAIQPTATDDLAEIVGLVYAEWKYLEKTHAYERSDEDWTIIISDLYNRFREAGDPLVIYKEWCTQKGIEVDHEEVKNLLFRFCTKK